MKGRLYKPNMDCLCSQTLYITLIFMQCGCCWKGLLDYVAKPISVSMCLGHASANAVKATAGAGPLVVPRV